MGAACQQPLAQARYRAQAKPCLAPTYISVAREWGGGLPNMALPWPGDPAWLMLSRSCATVAVAPVPTSRASIGCCRLRSWLWPRVWLATDRSAPVGPDEGCEFTRDWALAFMLFTAASLERVEVSRPSRASCPGRSTKGQP
jgi:hypothetical protein